MSSQASGGGGGTVTGGLTTYKQLQLELDSKEKKIKALLLLAEKTKVTHTQAVQDAIEQTKKEMRVEHEKKEVERIEQEVLQQHERDQQHSDSLQTLRNELELTHQKRLNESQQRTTTLYEQKFTELRNETLKLQRTYDDLHEQHHSLLEWQKTAISTESQWLDLKRSMQAEIEKGVKAEESLARYKTILKYMAIHKYIKDVKLKKRLLPLHTGCSRLITMILQDDELREKLVNQQGELAKWINDAHAIEKSEGIASAASTAASESTANLIATSASPPTTSSPSPSNLSAPRQFMASTNVESLVSSLLEVEHVLTICVATILRYNTHFKLTSTGFFERNSALTAYCMGVEKECREVKEKAGRTQSQLHASLALLSRLEVKYSQLSRKLSKEDRTLAQRYLQRHGITTTGGGGGGGAAANETTNGAGGEDTTHANTRPSHTHSASQSPQFGSLQIIVNTQDLHPSQQTKSTTTTDEKEDDPFADLSLLSPRALHRKLASQAPTLRTNGGAKSSSGLLEVDNGVQGRSRPTTSDGTARRRSPPPHKRNGSSSVAAAATKLAYASATGTMNLATAAPILAVPTNVSSGQDHGRTRRRKIAGSKKKSSQHSHTEGDSPPHSSHSLLDCYASSSEDEEYTVRPVSYTPPPSGAEIRAFDWARGDKSVMVEGVKVEIGEEDEDKERTRGQEVPTIEQAMRGEPVRSIVVMKVKEDVEEAKEEQLNDSSPQQQQTEQRSRRHRHAAADTPTSSDKPPSVQRRKTRERPSSSPGLAPAASSPSQTYSDESKEQPPSHPVTSRGSGNLALIPNYATAASASRAAAVERDRMSHRLFCAYEESNAKQKGPEVNVTHVIHRVISLGTPATVENSTPEKAVHHFKPRPHSSTGLNGFTRVNSTPTAASDATVTIADRSQSPPPAKYRPQPPSSSSKQSRPSTDTSTTPQKSKAIHALNGIATTDLNPTSTPSPNVTRLAPLTARTKSTPADAKTRAASRERLFSAKHDYTQNQTTTATSSVSVASSPSSLERAKSAQHQRPTSKHQPKRQTGPLTSTVKRRATETPAKSADDGRGNEEQYSSDEEEDAVPIKQPSPPQPTAKATSDLDEYEDDTVAEGISSTETRTHTAESIDVNV